MSNLQQQLATIRQGTVQPVYLVSGTEHYLIERFKQTIITAVLDGDTSSDFNFTTFNMEEDELQAAVQEAESIPFFGKQRLVFVTHPTFLTGKPSKSDPDHNLEALVNYLQAPADFSVLVIFAPYEKLDKRKKITKTLLKQAEVIDASPMDTNALARYVKEAVQTQGYRFQDGAFNALMERTDYQLTTIMSELQKLYLYHMEDKYITRYSIDELVTRTLESNIFEINELVLTKQANQAIQVFADLLLQKEEPLKILAIMLSQFRLLLQVHILRAKGYQQAEIAKEISAHPYRVKLAMQTERRFNRELLAQAYQQLIQAEYRIKTGQVDPELQFELFVMQFTGQKEL